MKVALAVLCALTAVLARPYDQDKKFTVHEKPPELIVNAGPEGVKVQARPSKLQVIEYPSDKEEESHHFFIDISRGLGGLKTKFNNIALSIRTHLSEALSDPELVSLQEIIDEENILTEQFKKLEANREKITY